MQDALIEMGRLPLAKNMLRRLGIRTPPELIRSYRPWSDEMLEGKRLLINDNGVFRAPLTAYLKDLKAQLDTTKLNELAQFNYQALKVNKVFQGTVFDASGIKELAELDRLYSFFHPLRGRIGFNHRVVIILPQAKAEQSSPEAMAIAHAIESFAKSLAKELGPRGVNVNAIKIRPDLEQFDLLAPLVAFFLSDFCAFVTGQVLSLRESSGALTLPALAGSLAGKRALVTGAAQGIGYSICRRLAEEGAHVICLDRPEAREALEDLAHTIEGETLFAVLGEAEGTQAVQSFLDRSPGLDILVHNAGITRDRTLFSMSEEQWEQVMRVNLKAVVELTNSILHRGALNRGGRVICMSSVVGIAGNFGQTNYSASKGGLIGYVEGLAHHLARENATANAVAPGFIETSMTAAIPFVAKQFARRLSSLGQGGLPDDVADAVAFLASPCSQGLSGSVLRVCGGSFLGA